MERKQECKKKEIRERRGREHNLDEKKVKEQNNRVGRISKNEMGRKQRKKE